MENDKIEVLKQVRDDSKEKLINKDEEILACKKNIIKLKNELQSIKDCRKERLSLKKLANKLGILECILFACVIVGTYIICKNVSIILGFLNMSFMGLAAYVGSIYLYDHISNKRIEKDNKENHTDEIIDFKQKKLNHEKLKYDRLKNEREILNIIYEENKNNYLKEKNKIITCSVVNNIEEKLLNSKPKTKIKKLND